jgi:agmatinase
MSQQLAFEYLRHGQSPFFRLPSVDRDVKAPYAGLDAAVLGVPHDGGTTYQPGARLAPYHVRRVSGLIQGYHPGHRVDVFRTLAVADAGNVVFPPFDRPAMRAAVEAEIAAVVAAGARPFVVGGDHSITYPILRALHAARGPIAVVHVDAHLDTSGPEVWGDEFHHGTSIRHGIVEGLIAPGQLYQIGIRAPWGHPEEGALAEQHGAVRIPAAGLEAGGASRTMATIRERIGNRPVYLTFDVDGVDPAFAPGTGTPVPGGLTTREALEIVRGLAGLDLIGMDVVEVAPALDHADATSTLAAHLVFEGLAIVARARRY